MPLTALPPERRFLLAEDNFRPAAEATPGKNVVNARLAVLSAMVSNQRCLVLDGPACGTVHVLRQGSRRPAADLVVPNVVTSSYEQLLAAGICTPFHGSVRMYMDGNPDERFGLVYLDYCCRLDAGRYQLEKSPTADVATLFRLGLCDRFGCILAVTLAKDDKVCDRSRPPAPMRLRRLVDEVATAAGMVAQPFGPTLEYGAMFVEIFRTRGLLNEWPSGLEDAPMEW